MKISRCKTGVIVLQEAYKERIEHSFKKLQIMKKEVENYNYMKILKKVTSNAGSQNLWNRMVK